MYEEFKKTGAELLREGLIHSNAGNMSVRKGDVIYITGHGSCLGNIGCSDIVKVNLRDEKRDAPASVEIKVHRAVYNYDDKIRAIVHAHPVYSIVLSFDYEKIVPVDVEGQFYIPEIPVLFSCAETIGSECVQEKLPELLARNRIAVVRGHGVFSTGKTLDEAYAYISVLECASQIIYLKEVLRRPK